MVVTFPTRTVTFKSKIGKYRKSFLTSFKIKNVRDVFLRLGIQKSSGQVQSGRVACEPNGDLG